MHWVQVGRSLNAVLLEGQVVVRASLHPPHDRVLEFEWAETQVFGLRTGQLSEVDCLWVVLGHRTTVFGLAGEGK